MASETLRQRALELAHQQVSQNAMTYGNAVDPAQIVVTAETYERYMSGAKEREENEVKGFRQTAMIAHEVIRALQIAHDEEGIAHPWHEVSQDIRNSCVIGVKAVYDNPDITVEELHESWNKTKLEQGWVWGPVRNTERKEHHCLVPYADLSAHDKSKDLLFLNTVKACLNIPIG